MMYSYNLFHLHCCWGCQVQLEINTTMNKMGCRNFKMLHDGNFLSAEQNMRYVWSFLLHKPVPAFIFTKQMWRWISFSHPSDYLHVCAIFSILTWVAKKQTKKSHRTSFIGHKTRRALSSEQCIAALSRRATSSFKALMRRNGRVMGRSQVVVWGPPQLASAIRDRLRLRICSLLKD